MRFDAEKFSTVVAVASAITTVLWRLAFGALLLSFAFAAVCWGKYQNRK